MRRPPFDLDQLPPKVRACWPTIRREAIWWAHPLTGPLRHTHTINDLQQEGWIVAMRVLKHFKRSRKVKLETYLTTALHRHFRYMVTTALRRALTHAMFNRLDDADPAIKAKHEALTAHSPIDDLDHELDLELGIERLERLDPESRRLALALARCGGKIIPLAQLLRLPLYIVRPRVHALRARLKAEA